MGSRYDQRQQIRTRLEEESGTIFKAGLLRVGLVYPSPYRVGMSSLGFQTIYKIINTRTEHAAERAFLPDDSDETGPLLTYESLTPVGDCDVIAISLSYELEIGGVISCLERAGLAPLASNRAQHDPLVIIGGPLTFSNPLPVAPFADAVVMGEGETAIEEALELVATRTTRSGLLEELSRLDGLFVPTHSGAEPTGITRVDNDLLPASSQIITKNTELSNMHLVEAERGCHRRCTFCVMRRSSSGGMRLASPERIMASIPEHAKRVGLVGAAVTDHPDLLEILEGIISSGRGLGVSSLRADRLSPALVDVLSRGGYRTLTVAGDGASQRLRDELEKGINADHLRRACELAASCSMRSLKLYMMLGVPGERDEDVEELITLVEELRSHLPIVLAISPFVSKRNTPLDEKAFAGVNVINRRMKLLRRRLRKKIEIRSTSARWAWVEYCMAQGGTEMGLAALDAHKAGGTFADWKEAVGRRAPRFIDMLTGK